MYYDDDFQQSPQFFPPMGQQPPIQPLPEFIPRPRPPFFPQQPWPDGSQGIRRCLNRNTMIYLHDGRSFWFFPTNVTPNQVMGFRFTRRGWVWDTVMRQNIRFFECR